MRDNEKDRKLHIKTEYQGQSGYTIGKNRSLIIKITADNAFRQYCIHRTVRK